MGTGPDRASDRAEAKRLYVRCARLDDVETIAAFNRGVALESEGLALDPAVVAAGVRDVLADPLRGQYYVAEFTDAEAAGRLVGQTMITREWSDWRCGWIWWIQSVYVEPAFRQRGVFQTLYEHVRTLARRDPQVVALRLYAHRENRRALTCYRSLGMQPTEYVIYEAPGFTTGG
ncbi:MAG TPA: GNAT family N-acetyltransferase [Phycisphaerae bacterium]|nr:GNAT family N-acetyltransferase [Phycisphaerae bacterium]HNU45146.1 GNAT family N-acetyltransferase [Phycisphaerae bacterium]